MAFTRYWESLERDAARLVEELQPADGGHDLHAVVRGQPEAAGGLLAVAAKDQQDAIAAGPGVRLARAVGVDGDFFAG
jgi:hypothetical protein